MNVYLNPIANGITVSLLIIYLALLPVLVYQYRKYDAFRLRKNIVLASFALYMITAFFMTLLPLPTIEAVKNMESIKANLHPFLFVKTFLNESGFIWNEIGTWLGAFRSSSFYTVAFNFLLTLPFGVYLRKYFKQSLPKVAMWGFLLSLFYEATQLTGVWGIYPYAFRFADVDDLIVNTLGAGFGFYVGGLIEKLLPDPLNDKAAQTEHASLLRRLLSLIIDSICVNISFELIRTIAFLFTGSQQNSAIDILIYIVSGGIVFILIPLISKKRRTLGMSLLKLSLKDRNGNLPKSLKITLHNLLIGLWLVIMPSVIGMIRVNGIIILMQFVIWGLLIATIAASIKSRRISYFWESLIDVYISVEK